MPALPKRALLVIDVQNEYFTGRLPIEYPDPALSLANIGRALDAAEAHGIPVVLVQHVTPESAPIFARGSDGGALHPAIAGRKRDLLVEKTLASAFAGTPLADWLKKQGVDTITVVGYMTQNCDDSTARHAAHAGLSVEFLHDASGALSFANHAGHASAEEVHRVFNVVLQTNFAAVMSTDEWLAVLASGGQPVRDNILASNLAGRARVAAAG